MEKRKIKALREDGKKRIKRETEEGWKRWENKVGKGVNAV